MAVGTQMFTLCLEIVSTRRGSVTPVWVRCPAGAPWRTVRAAFVRAGFEVPEHPYTGDRMVRDADVVGTPPLLHHAVLCDTAADQTRGRLLELVVIEGPDTGARYPIAAGEVSVGRDAACHLQMTDPDISRRHCVLRQEQGRMTLTDEASTNGTAVDAEPLTAHRPSSLRTGARIRAGRSTLMVVRAPIRSHPTEHDGAGRVVMHRPPRRVYPSPPATLTAPTPPRETGRRAIPWAMILLPMVLALAMVLVFHNTMFLMFALFSPAMMLGQYLSDRRGSGRRGDKREYASKRQRFEQKLADALAAEASQRRHNHPTLTELADIASALGDRLWQREPHHRDFLEWRVGTGTVRSSTVVRSDGHDSPRDLQIAPVTVPLATRRVVGVCGRRPITARLMASLAMQLGVLHPPHRVQILVVCDDPHHARAWAWARGLPHVTSNDRPQVIIADPNAAAFKRLVAHLSQRHSDSTSSDAARGTESPDTVLVLDSALSYTVSPALADLIAEPDNHGLAVVAIADARDDLPPSCTAVVEAQSAHKITVTDGEHTLTATPDLPSEQLVDVTIRRLSHIIDASPEADSNALPAAVDLIGWQRDLHDLDLTAVADIVTSWQCGTGCPAAELGVTADGPLTVDLVADGPHALVAGTTGSGKSELLQTLIMSLAAANRPDQLVFVLIDYKGGAAFKDCALLPHTVGLVTDLDGHLTSRALVSLEAELRRRERLLAENGAKDLTDYSGEQPLPRLMLVIDEFRVLAEELPDFISGLVRVATVGRSLGIHLILATQRPAGVVSPEIRANVNLRIALRVRDESDSHDVIGSSRAAGISSSQPGRAYLRSGGAQPTEFQTARVGGVSSSRSEESVMVAAADPDTGEPLWPAANAEGAEPDLRQLAGTVIAAADRIGAAMQPSPWLPALPEDLAAGDLPPTLRDLAAQQTRQTTPAWPIALLDLPAEQSIVSACWCPDTDGQLAVIGGPRSGRTGALRTAAAQACCATPPDRLHLYVFDAGNGLAALRRLPHCGARVGRDDVGRMSRIIDWLTDEIRRRQSVFAAVSAGDYAEFTAEGSTPMPRILLVIDGWEAFAETSDDATAGRLMDEFAQVIRDGAPVGICAVVAGGRALSSSRVSALFTRRIALRMPDETDLLMLGLRSGQLPTTMPAGRGILLPDATELQFATLGGDPSSGAQAAHIQDIAASMPATDPSMRRFDPLPTGCRIVDLPPVPPDIVPVGLGGDDLHTSGLPAPGAAPLLALIAGPARSGRTTALCALARGLCPRWPTAFVGTAQPGTLPDGATRIEPCQLEVLGTWCERDGVVLLVDDVDGLIGTPAEDALLHHRARLRTAGGGLIAAGTTSTLGGVFRGLIPELRRGQTGLLLQPGRHDGDLLGVDVPAMDVPRPGHGILVVAGERGEVQVAQ